MSECEEPAETTVDPRGRLESDELDDPPCQKVDAFQRQDGLAPSAAETSTTESGPSGGTAAETPITTLDEGPGHELEILFLQLGVPYREDCGCRAYARQMDAWGVHGCQEHIKEIVQRLRENAQKYSLMERLATALTAVSSGLAFRFNLLDPFPGIVAEAIRRAGDRRQDCSNTNLGSSE